MCLFSGEDDSTNMLRLTWDCDHLINYKPCKPSGKGLTKGLKNKSKLEENCRSSGAADWPVAAVWAGFQV